MNTPTDKDIFVWSLKYGQVTPQLLREVEAITGSKRSAAVWVVDNLDHWPVPDPLLRLRLVTLRWQPEFK